MGTISTSELKILLLLGEVRVRRKRGWKMRREALSLNRVPGNWYLDGLLGERPQDARFTADALYVCHWRSGIYWKSLWDLLSVHSSRTNASFQHLKPLVNMYVCVCFFFLLLRWRDMFSVNCRMWFSENHTVLSIREGRPLGWAYRHIWVLVPISLLIVGS